MLFKLFLGTDYYPPGQNTKHDTESPQKVMFTGFDKIKSVQSMGKLNKHFNAHSLRNCRC